ncbi:uncharacterized protein LOC134532289 [Bacillus rossius redtenbacheri]|uniref:uncharacterized protein LOC134532289 n=1 Tax=Bacillus rossius redtenbacheri TaxID=93214 RepID=UPI002FDEDCA4
MSTKVVRILSLAALLATCVENKEKTQIKLKQLSPYLQPPPLAKTPSNSATTKLGAVKLRLSSAGKVKSQISAEDSSVQRVPRWNFGKEATTDTFSVPKDRKNHGSSRPSGTRTKLFPLNSSQRQETAGSSKRQRAILQYPPNQQFLSQSSHGHKSSKDCNPCNKVPWIPLLEHHASQIDTSVSDSVGHYSHHRDLPISPLGIPSSLIGPGRFKDSSLNFPDNSDRLKFNKPKDGVTYLPPALQTPIPWPQSSSYVTPYSSSIPKKVYTRLVHPERTPTGPPNQNVPQYNNPGPMYRYLVPPPIASQFPGENKYLPSLSSSLTSSKTETFYGLPFFIPQRSNTTRQHEKIVEPTLSPLSVQQAIPFTSPQGPPHYVNVNAKLQPEQIYFKNRSAHSLRTQFYEPANFFPVPPLHEAHTFSHGDYNVSLPENLVPPEISVGNVAFSAEQQENVHQHQISHSSHGTDNDLKLLDVRGSVFDVVPSIPVSEDFEVTHFNENLSQTTITEPSFSGLHPSEDQVISPSQNNQNSNTNFFNTQEQYNTPVGSQYHSNTPSQTDSNLEVIKSVQVANYISSIEYPLQFVHSPYIDINTTSSIESLRNTSFHETKELHQTPQPENASHINFNPDTSDIIVGKPITLESSAYDIFNTTSGEYQNSIPNFEQQKFENSDNYNIHQNYSSFDASDYNLRQNLSSYLSENSNEFAGGSEDYSFVWNNTSKDFHHNFKSHINNSEEANVRLTVENNNVWYNSQYEATTQKYTDTLKEESHTVTSQQAAYFNPLSTASPQQKVTVYIQPSIQTTALHDASLVRQINNLDQQHHHSFAHDQILSSYRHESPHSVIKNPKGAFTIQQQGPPPAPFRNMFSDIENMYPPPFNYIGVIKRPLHLQTNSASVHNPFINNLPQNFFNTAQNEGHIFNQYPQPGQDEYVKWTTSPGSTSAPIPTRPPIVPAWKKPTTSMPPQDSVHGQSIHTINSAGLLPPPMPHHIRTNVPTKNTKQIQIIVPYTSGKDSLPFLPQRGRPLDIETTGWHPMTGSQKGESVAKNCSNSNIRQISECNTGTNLNQWWQQQEDYHQHQESRTVTATASATSNPFQATLTNLNSLIREGSNKQKPFTVTQQHILASNIQDLLRGEQENITIPDSIDLKQLQKYIDDWTASEYSSFNASVNTSKANEVQSGVTPESHNSIVSHQLIPSKKIPAEYLTTPPSIFDDFM